MNPQLILAVAIGGAIGSGKLFGIGFPRGTLIINVTGSFLIGAFVGLFATKWDLPQVARVFLTVGICGGYPHFPLSRWTPGI
jgi:CrcB protein